MARGRKRGNPDYWRDWYQYTRWATIRADQLRSSPLCVVCLRKGMVVPAKIADHIEHHDGDWNRFILGKLQSLCEPCHREKHRTLRYGRKLTFGLDGWPIDDEKTNEHEPVCDQTSLSYAAP